MYRATNSDWQKLSTLGYQLSILVEAECPVHEQCLRVQELLAPFSAQHIWAHLSRGFIMPTFAQRQSMDNANPFMQGWKDVPSTSDYSVV